MHYNKHFLSEKRTDLNKDTVDGLIRHALIEDIGKGDITTTLTIPEDKDIKAHLLAKEDCVICGIEIVERTFQLVDKNIEFKAFAREGQKVTKDKILAVISGKARSILNGERVALNMITLLSGIATKTREYVDRVEPHKVKITDTRKTMPGLRELSKYAVRVGGGYNHRISLDEMILIKDNHIKITEGYNKLPKAPKGFKIEIEAQNFDEFKHALQFKPDVIMLDNMQAKDIKAAVDLRNSTDYTKSHHPKTKLEASGGITLENVKEIAATGVDIISLGDLTHSIDSVDICLDVV
jgi:nicotinate-nucleotide pyrophosphorylase (carboxylating)